MKKIFHKKTPLSNTHSKKVFTLSFNILEMAHNLTSYKVRVCIISKWKKIYTVQNIAGMNHSGHMWDSQREIFTLAPCSTEWRGAFQEIFVKSESAVQIFVF